MTLVEAAISSQEERVADAALRCVGRWGVTKTTLDDVALAAAPFLAPYVGAEHAGRVAEWVARLVISYTLTPSDQFDLADEESVRALVRGFVLPGLATSVLSTTLTKGD